MEVIEKGLCNTHTHNTHTHTPTHTPSACTVNPRCIQFMCSRLWDSYQYFSFNATWILPPNIVYRETIAKFVLQARLINTEVKERTEATFGFEELRIQAVSLCNLQCIEI